MRTAWGVPRRLGVLFIPNVIGLPEIQSQRVPVELLPFRNVSCRGDAHLVGIAADNPRRFYIDVCGLAAGRERQCAHHLSNSAHRHSVRCIVHKVPPDFDSPNGLNDAVL